MGDARKLLRSILGFVMVFSAVFLLYHAVRCYTDVNSPLIVVMSGSMEPAFARGDVLILYNDRERYYKPGDIIVYHIPSKIPPIPVVHRVHDVHVTQQGEELLLTKGDNNPVNDRIMLGRRQRWIAREDVEGRVLMYLPYLGYVSLMLQMPWVRYSAILVVFFIGMGG